MKNQERDPLEPLLRHALAARDRAQAPGVCLDADTLAAWADDGLTSGERSAAESHAASCARCQASLAAMVRTELPVAPVALRSRLRPWLTWLTPVAAAATALALWVAVERSPATQEEPRQAETVAPAPVAAPLAKSATPQERDFKLGRTSPYAEKDRADTIAGRDDKNERTRQVAGAREKADAKRAAEGFAEKPADAFDSRARASGVAGGVAAGPPQVATTPAPPPAVPLPAAVPPVAAPVQNAAQNEVAQNRTAQNQAAQNQAAQNQPAQTQQTPPAPVPASGRQAGQLAEQVVVGDSKALAAGGRGARGAVPAREEALRDQVGEYRRNAPIDVASPDPSIRWRIVDGRNVQRSIDGGLSWQVQSAEVPQPIAAGFAPTASVCWLVGQGGVVMLTTDGRTWQRITFPEAVALTAVRATDARAATVTTADGRVFNTEDGGKTWIPK